MHSEFPYSLGLLSEDLVDLAGSPLDALCSYLQKQLQYRPGERDAIYLHHFIGIEWPNNKVKGGRGYDDLYPIS